jgi:hypothetical protein
VAPPLFRTRGNGSPGKPPPTPAEKKNAAGKPGPKHSQLSLFPRRHPFPPPMFRGMWGKTGKFWPPSARAIGFPNASCGLPTRAARGMWGKTGKFPPAAGAHTLISPDFTGPSHRSEWRRDGWMAVRPMKPAIRMVGDLGGGFLGWRRYENTDPRLLRRASNQGVQVELHEDGLRLTAPRMPPGQVAPVAASEITTSVPWRQKTFPSFPAFPDPLACGR